MIPARETTRAALAALVALLVAGAAVPAAGWSEFGVKKDTAPVEGPEIREPFFEFLIDLAERDSVGQWTGDQLRAHAAAAGRESRFPLQDVVLVSRERPDRAATGRYQGAGVRAVWTILLTGPLDRAMPYSILGYHPGSLRVSRKLVLGELGPMDLQIRYQRDGGPVSDLMTDVRVFSLEQGYVLLDADGLLDAMLGSGLDDAWTLGFVIAREKGKLIGLGVSLGRDGRHIFGEFDFSRDKVLAHGRPPMAALSRASRRWLNVETSGLPEPWVEE